MHTRRSFAGLGLVAAMLISACSTAAEDTVPPATPQPSAEPTLAGVPDGATFADPPPEAPSAPEFSVDLLDGTAVDGADIWADRPLLMHLFETDCTTCPEQERQLDAAAQEYPGLAVLSVAGSSDPDDVLAYRREHELDHPVGSDPTRALWQVYGAGDESLVVLVGPGGALLRGWPGGVDEATLTGALDELVATPDTDTTAEPTAEPTEEQG